EGGAWTYNVDNADVQYLDEGETKEEVFTITSQDGTEHIISVTITGVNDAAIISGNAVGEVVEDESTPTLTDNGQLTITDADGVLQEVFDPTSVVPAADVLGTLTLTEDGAWDYSVINSDVQYLDEGETKDEVFTIASQDGTAHTITVTITGVNDAAEISGVDTGAVTEDETSPTLTDSGQLTIT
ncbi:VCBS domain-containing protein, partial [Vibrio sp. 10N.286.49.B3]|uniref:VCBS domain-containing protein n=1 Tax=Vibrio sp. 10N.286.49.B3 TaxID=1880855 RepID=UPI0018E41AD5